MLSLFFADLDIIAGQCFLSVHHSGDLQIVGLPAVYGNTEGLGIAPIPFFAAAVLYAGIRPIGRSGLIYIIMLCAIDGRPGNISIAVAFDTGPQVLGCRGNIGIIFHGAEGDAQVFRDLQHLRDGDGEILSIAIGGGHADKLTLAVEKTAAAAALRDDGSGGNDILIEAFDDAGGDFIPLSAGRADGCHRFAHTTGKRGGGGFQAAFVDTQDGNIRCRFQPNHSRCALIDGAICENELRGGCPFDDMIIGGDEPIGGENHTAALHLVGLDIDHGAFHVVFCGRRGGIDGNSGGAAIPGNLCAAVFRQKTEGDEGAAVFDLRRGVDGNGLAVDSGSLAVDAQRNGYIFIEGQHGLGVFLPVDGIAQSFQNAPHGRQHTVVFDKRCFVEGELLVIHEHTDGGCGYSLEGTEP